MSLKAAHSTEYKQIIERLKKARTEANLKQSDVAKRLGKPQSYISKIEARERRVDILEIKKLANIYKKPVSFFIGE